MPRGAPRLRTIHGRINSVGERTETRALQLKLTQDMLCARLAKVTAGGWIADRRDIYRIIHGQRIVSDLELIALAGALECDACWLLRGDDGETIRFQTQPG